MGKLLATLTLSSGLWVWSSKGSQETKICSAGYLVIFSWVEGIIHAACPHLIMVHVLLINLIY